MKDKRLQILLVDDDEDLISIVQAFLRDDGFRVAAALDGESGLATAIENPPSLLLLDMVMPGMSGMEVFKRLQEHPRTKDVPVIFLTALDEENLAKSTDALGAAGYLSKPFEGEDLITLVRGALAENV